jgi:hypothetical protein
MTPIKAIAVPSCVGGYALLPTPASLEHRGNSFLTLAIPGEDMRTNLQSTDRRVWKLALEFSSVKLCWKKM